MSMSGDSLGSPESTERNLKRLILKKYRYKCIFDRRHTEVLHEIKPRSLGGKISFENSVPLCDKCHDWAHRVGSKIANPVLKRKRKQRLKEYESVRSK